MRLGHGIHRWKSRIGALGSKAGLRTILVLGIAFSAAQVSTHHSRGNFAEAEANQPEPLPDLTPYLGLDEPFVSVDFFAPQSCTVVEGHVQPGIRRLLHFSTETRNVGAGDLILGDPATNPLFQLSECHGHLHWDGFADYRLMDSEGLVVAGHKTGFCLLDTVRHDPSAPPDPLYDCDFQGIQAGWGDVYDFTVDGQWIDVTDVPDGDYTLEVELNPDQGIEESDYSNNVASVEVTISGGEFAPILNDLCEDALDICPGSYSGNNTNAMNEGSTSCVLGGPDSLHDVWFTYTPAWSGEVTIDTAGSDFDTVLSVHHGCPGTIGNELVCNDDVDFESGDLTSRVTFQATFGEHFHIRLAGYFDSTGEYTLNLTGPGCAGIPDMTGLIGAATADGNFNCGSLDTEFGRFTPMGPNLGSFVHAMAYDRNSETVYAAVADSVGANTLTSLATIDPTTGTLILVGPNGVATGIDALAFDPNSNTLYGTAQELAQLYTIDTATGAATPVGSPQAGKVIGAMAFDPVTNTLYGINDTFPPTAESELVTIDTATGALTTIGSLGHGVSDVNSLAFFDIDRFLYAIFRSTDELLKIDPATGHSSVVGDTATIWGVTYGMTSIDLGESGVSRIDPSRSYLRYR